MIKQNNTMWTSFAARKIVNIIIDALKIETQLYRRFIKGQII